MRAVRDKDGNLRRIEILPEESQTIREFSAVQVNVLKKIVRFRADISLLRNSFLDKGPHITIYEHMFI